MRRPRTGQAVLTAACPRNQLPSTNQRFSPPDVTVSTMSKNSADRSAVEQPNRGVERRRSQVHVALRRAQIAMPREFLNRPARRARMRPDVCRKARWRNDPAERLTTLPLHAA